MVYSKNREIGDAVLASASALSAERINVPSFYVDDLYPGQHGIDESWRAFRGLSGDLYDINPEACQRWRVSADTGNDGDRPVPLWVWPWERCEVAQWRAPDHLTAVTPRD